MRSTFYSIGITVGLSLWACSKSSSFKSATAEKSPGDDVSEGQNGDGNGEGNGTGAGNGLNIDASSDAGQAFAEICGLKENEPFKWAEGIQRCFDDKGFYHFESSTCFYFDNTSSECNWDEVVGKLDKDGLTTEDIKQEKESGSKIVSCSESANNRGKFHVVQSISLENLNNVGCEELKNGAGIFTGCYALLNQGENDLDTTQGKAGMVKDCSERGSTPK